MKLERFIPLCAACLAALPLVGLRAEATLEVGQAAAAPGEMNIVVPISILLDPEEGLVTGLEFTVRYDSSVLGGVLIEAVDDVDFFNFMEQSTFMQPGNTAAAIVWKLFGRPDGVTTSGVVANLQFCVLETAAAGTYPLEILLEAERSLEMGRRVVNTVYTVDGESHVPVLAAGSITIQGEPVLGGNCEPDDRTPPVIEPPPPLPDVLLATFTLEDRTAIPGTTFSTPLIMNGNAEISGFSVSIDFDEGVLQGTGVEAIYERPSGEDYDFMIVTINNSDDIAGNAGIDEGFVIGAVVFSLGALIPDVLARDEHHEVLDVHFLVRPEATGGITDISFVDGAQGDGQPVDNVATIYHESVPPETKASMILVSSLVAVVGDASAFVRGDSNDDGTLDLSDARYTLDFLFLGGLPPICLDAADTNDDGEVDISDAVRALSYLFVGAEPPPPPTEVEPGWDLTFDTLGCGPPPSS